MLLATLTVCVCVYLLLLKDHIYFLILLNLDILTYVVISNSDNNYHM